MATRERARDDLMEKAYKRITGEEEVRVCKAIPEEACTDVPRNFFLNVANGTSTKLAEQLASPGLVLPWFLAALGAPASLAGWLMPVRRAGSLLPQLFVAGEIRKQPRRKWFWVGAGIVQALCLAGMILAALTMSPLWAGWTVVGLLAVFSIASGAGSVSFSDVVGKTIPKTRRGRLLGLRAAFGGVLTVAAGLLLKLEMKGVAAITPYLVLIAVAAGLWALGSLFFALITELKGATEGGGNAWKEAARGWKFVREVPGFRTFLLSRALLLLAIELALPYYSLHARTLVEGTLGNLGIFVIVTGISAAVSSTIWGAFADRSSRGAMIAAGLIGAATGAIALGIGQLPDEWQTVYMYAPVFFLIGLAVAGIRMGRKTWIVDAAPERDRPTYVAFSNTVIGVVTIAGGAMGLIGHAFGMNVMIAVLLGLSLLGALVTWFMPEADDMVEEESG